MFDLVLDHSSKSTAVDRIIQSQRTWRLWMGFILAITCFAGAAIYLTRANVNLIAWVIYLAGLAVILYRPRYGVYLILFFGLAGDGYMTPWFPFLKGFSSPEALLYVNDALIISPLETYIILTFVSWLSRGIAQRKINFHAGNLFWPALAFLLFTFTGLAYGIGTGGNVNVALWEARPLFYLVSIIVLASNLLEKREHISHLIWAAVLALFFETIIGDLYFFFVLNRDLTGVEALNEHSVPVHLNVIFILALSIFLYKTPGRIRIVLPIMLPFMLLLYIANQRRASFVALAIALTLLAVALFIDNRKAFTIFVPPLLLIAVVYLAIFWNSSGATGLPARAIKSMILPSQATYRDQSSNVYRVVENININYTIHQKPLTGVGFGQVFYIIIPMADISFFTWWQYMSHNSIFWIWLKMGVLGFFVMLFFVGTAILTGTHVYLHMPNNQLRAFALTATLYIVMHFVYAYVDISWDSQSMVLIGSMMGMINCLERVAAQPVTLPKKRWPWQPDLQPE